MILPSSCVAFLHSSAEESPFLGFLEWMGKRISFDLYSFNRCAFSWSDSTDLFLLKCITNEILRLIGELAC